MLEEQVFYFFYKIKTSTKGQEFVRQQKWARALDGAMMAQFFPDCVIHKNEWRGLRAYVEL